MISDTLEQDGLISFGIGKEAKKIALHYVSNPVKYENSNAIEIEDFDDFYIYYEAYSKKQRIKECQECGKLILVKGNASTKYCDKCAKQKKLEQTLKSNSKTREK